MRVYFALESASDRRGRFAGTWAGITFFMLMARRTGEAVQITAVGRIVVLANFLFTATTVLAQPITGIALA